MKVLHTLVLMFATQMCLGQARTIKSLFKQFQEDIEIEQAHNGGNVVWDDDTKEDYYLLMRVIPVDSLVKFAAHPNAAIRCIVFSSLLNKNADRGMLKAIADAHLTDTAIFKVKPTDVYNEETVSAYMQNSLQYAKANNAVIDYEKAINHLRPYPRLMIDGLRHGIIRREKIGLMDSLTLTYSSKLEIASFTLTLLCLNKNDTISLKSENNCLTTAMKEEIGALGPGDKAFIDDIKVRLEDGTIRTLMSVVMEIE